MMSQERLPELSGKPLPSFENPPVIEVVWGVLFKTLENLLIPHFGALWERFQPDYATCQEASPLMPVIERFGELPPTDIGLPADFPLPRVWFVHKDGNGVIQVQRDRFLHNWKKANLEDPYPRYHTIKELFDKHLMTFKTFLDDSNLGSLVPRQYEMTYINHIPQGEGWDTIDDIGKVFPDFAWDTRKERFLPGPAGRNLRTHFDLPKNAGRLHVTIRTGVRRADSRPIVLLELTVRGMPDDTSPGTMWRWFDLAREWIVRGFADLTGEQIQQTIWRRTT